MRISDWSSDVCSSDLTGFINKGATDIGMADISMRGVGTFVYDPTLDDLGREDFIYFIDPRHLFLMVMEGEDMKTHAPARPAEKSVLYRAVTWTGGPVCRKMNRPGERRGGKGGVRKGKFWGWPD